MVSLFDTLLKQKAKGDKIPTEDFFTEIFAHLLHSNYNVFIEFLRAFKLSDIVPENGHHIMTQLQFYGSRPDITIKLSDGDRSDLLFIENKIDSPEGFQQLKKYAEELSRHTHVDRTTLVYITRDYDRKDEKDILRHCPINSQPVFKQLRWHEVYRFLEKYEEDNLVFEVLKFMEANNMARNNLFSPVDILTLTNFPRVRKMMDETMKGEVSDLFKKVTGNIAKDSTLLTQLRNNNRYVYQSWQDESMWCGYGYWFNPSDIANYPDVGVILEAYPNSPERDIIIAAMKKIINRDPDKWKGYDLTAPKAWSRIWQGKSLKDFMGSEDHIAAIENFFLQAINDLDAIKTEYPDLPWMT